MLAYPIGPTAIRTYRRTNETFDAIQRSLTDSGLLLPSPGWWLLRLLSAAALGLSVAGSSRGNRLTAGVVAGLAVVNLLLPRSRPRPSAMMAE